MLIINALDERRLKTIRTTGSDEHGHPVTPYPATGDGEPLRCCLRYADAGESIALISYAPLEADSPWREVGPVYVHAEDCPGHGGGLPSDLRTGPRVLRSYGADGALRYDDIRVIDDGADIEPALIDLLARPQVAQVHVRALASQCFLFSVTR